MTAKIKQVNIIPAVKRLCEARSYDEATKQKAEKELRNAIRLARCWNYSQTEYNRVQFLDAFNSMKEGDQMRAVAKHSEISRILIGWSAATRLELGIK